jgi:hypothetical protein
MPEDTKQRFIQEVIPHAESYWPETAAFLYSGSFLKRKRRMKYGLMVSAFERDLVHNDYVATLFNARKTFSEINTGIIKYRRNKVRNLSLTTVGRLKRSILFRTNEMLFLTHRFAAFRNLTLKVSDHQYSFLGFNTYARLRNKWMFFTLLYSLNTFNFKRPSLIMYKFRKSSRLRVYYLGFKLLFKKKLLTSSLKRTPLMASRRKRLKRIKLRKLLKIRKRFRLRIRLRVRKILKKHSKRLRLRKSLKKPLKRLRLKKLSKKPLKRLQLKKLSKQPSKRRRVKQK